MCSGYLQIFVYFMGDHPTCGFWHPWGSWHPLSVNEEGLCCSWLTGDITLVPLEYSFSLWPCRYGLCMWISSFLFWPSICSLGQFSLRGTNLSRPNFSLSAFSSSLYREHPGLWCVTLIPAWPGSLLLAHLGADSPSDYNWPWTLATSPWAPCESGQHTHILVSGMHTP